MTTPDLSATFATRAIGVQQPTISRYETGGRGPALDVLPRLADALGVTLAWLLGLDDTTEPTEEPS